MFLLQAFILVSAVNAVSVRRETVPVTVPLTRIVNSTGVANVTKNIAIYTASISIGDQTFNLKIDSGSANTWVGAQPNNEFQETNTTVKEGDTMGLTYGSEFVAGIELLDDITLGPGLTITNQSFCSEFSSLGFETVDGVLGIGPRNLTQGTLAPRHNATIPTVIDTAFTQGLIPSQEVGVFLQPTTTSNDAAGTLTFGGIDESKISGPIHYVPITTQMPAGKFVGIEQSITYGCGTVAVSIVNASAGIVDAGTTLLMLEESAYSTYQEVTGAVLDGTTGLLRITQEQYDNLESLLFNIGNATLEFTPNAQIWPRTLNSQIGGAEDAIYLIAGNLATSFEGRAMGVSFINGNVFLQRFYHLYDSGNNRAGFAETAFTYATTN